jgi:phosphatidylglycerophosphate synthase
VERRRGCEIRAIEDSHMFVAVPFFLRRGVTCVTRSITSSSSSLLRPSAARNARRSRRSLEFGRTHLPFVCRPFSTSTSHHEPAPENIYNIPNTLSLLRIVSSPFMSWLIVTQRYTAAALAFGAIAVTDVADGYIARNYNQKTVVGSFLDPMADKIQSIAVTGALGYQYLLSPWIVALLVGKDVCLMLGTVLVRIVAVVRLRREATQTAKRTDITAAQLDEAQQSLATLRSPVGFVGALFNVRDFRADQVGLSAGVVHRVL